MQRLAVLLVVSVTLVMHSTTDAHAATVPCSIYWDWTPRFVEGTPQDKVTFTFKVKCTRSWTVKWSLYTDTGSLLAIEGTSNQNLYLPDTNWYRVPVEKPVGWPGSWQYDRTYTFEVCFKDYPDENCTGTATLTIPPDDSGGGGDATALDVYSHTFIEPLIVNEEACEYIELEHTGSDTLNVSAIKLGFSGVSTTWTDDTDETDFTIDPDDIRKTGDPFCFTPLATGTLTIEVQAMLVGGSYVTVDSFTLSVGERPDPCTSRTCDDTCSGETRHSSCTPTPNGDTCDCPCAVSYDCNSDNRLDPPEEYCATNADPAESDVRSHQRYRDHTCTVPSGCVLYATEWRNDVFVEDCHYGCSVSGTDASCNENPCTGVSCPNGCDPENVRKDNGTTRVSGTTCVCDYTTYDCDLSDTSPARNEYCEGSERWYRDTWTDYDCAVDICRDTAMVDGEYIETCAYGCQDDGTTTVCIAQPCTLVSVTWSTASATEGDDVSFSIAHEGSCDVTVCPTYTIIERDVLPNPDDETVSGNACLDTNPKTVLWTTTHDDAEFGDSEYDVLVDLDAQHVETPDPLTIAPRDPCDGVSCPGYCDGDIKRFNGSPTSDGDTCVCSYKSSSDCNQWDKTDPAAQYCDGNTLRSHRWHNESWCSATSASCTASGYWVEDVLVEDCNGRDNTAAAVPYCRGAEMLWSHAWHQNFICKTDRCGILFEGWILGEILEDCDRYDTPLTTVEYCWDTNEDGAPDERRAFDTNEDYACITSTNACDVNATTMLNDRGLQTCAYQCAQTTDTTTACIPEPCTLTGVAWEESDGCVDAGTTASYTVTARGACTATDCFDYVVYEDDPEVPIDPFNWFEDTPLDSGNACLLDGASRTSSWLTRNTPPYVDNEEIRVAVRMHDRLITSEILCVARRDPCLDVECEDFCDSGDANIRWVARHWVDDSTGRCWCEHNREDCNNLDVPTGERATACREENVYAYTRYADYTCELGGCTVGSDEWRDELLAESCPAGCTQHDERTAECAPESCVPNWQHSEWNPPDCSAAEQTRTWWDEVCPGSVPYVESLPCPCALVADGVSWSERDAYEGGIAHLDVAIRGNCTDICFNYEIREVDFTDDPIEEHDLAAGGRRCLADGEYAGVTIPWNVVYLGPGSTLFSYEHFEDGEMGVNDTHGFVYHGGAVTSSLETQELNVYPTREPLAEDTEVFLEDLIAAGEFPTPSASIETCFVPGAVSDVVTVAPSPDCALWEHELGVEYLESEEVLSDIIDTVLGDSRRELVWTGGCLACGLGVPTLVAIGACEELTGGACTLIIIPAEVACIAFCGELLETRAVFAGRIVVKEVIEERLASRARALGIAGWDRYDYFIAESGAYAKATYVSPTGESHTLWEFPQWLGDAHINDRGVKNSLLIQPGGDEALRAMWRTKDRYGRVLVGFATPNPSPIGNALLANAARDASFETALANDMDDLFSALLVDPAVALEDLRYVDDVADYYGVTRRPSGGLPPTMRMVRVNLDRIARDFGDDASPILIHVIQPHEFGHTSINWWSRSRGYRDVSGPYDEDVEDFFTDHFRWSRASSARRAAFEEWAPKAQRRMLDLMPSDERGAMVRSFVSAVDDGRQPIGDEWDIVRRFAIGEIFASNPLKDDVLRVVNEASGGRADVRERLREYAQQLIDDAEVFSGRVASDAPDSIFDDLTCRKYRIYDCLMTSDGITDEAGDIDGIPGPDDETDDPETYDPDDPDGPGQIVPSDGTREKAPGATDGTGCACDTRGGADVPFLTIAAIAVSVRRRRPKRCL